MLVHAIFRLVSTMLPSGRTVRTKGPFSKKRPSVELAPGPPLSQINNGYLERSAVEVTPSFPMNTYHSAEPGVARFLIIKYSKNSKNNNKKPETCIYPLSIIVLVRAEVF